MRGWVILEFYEIVLQRISVVVHGCGELIAHGQYEAEVGEQPIFASMSVIAFVKEDSITHYRYRFGRHTRAAWR